MQKLDEARAAIASVLSHSKTPAIALSFGVDSVLVAALVLQQAPDTTCIWLHQCLTREQRAFPERLMVEWGLTVWSCGIQEWKIIQRDGHAYAAMTYALNGDTVTTVQDVVHQETAKCIFQQRPQPSQPISLPVDVLFTGWRKSDQHSLMPSAYAPERIGNIQLISPLADWTEEEVWAATFALSLPHNHNKYNGNPFADPDNLIANVNCLPYGECRCQPLISA